MLIINRLLIIIVILIVLASSCFAVSSLMTSLKDYYSFDNTLNTNGSNGGANLTVSGTAVYGTVKNTGIISDGTWYAYHNVAYPEDFAYNFTVNCWVNSTGKTANAGFYNFLTSDGGGNNAIGFGQYEGRPTDDNTFRNTIGGGNYIVIDSRIQYNNLYMITITGYSNYTNALYINGTFYNSTNLGTTRVLIGSYSNHILDIFRNSINSVTSSKQKLDDCGIWNRSLTVAEISSLWNTGTGLFYPFVIPDSSPEITFINQTPSDINITSFGTLRIFYNISDDIQLNKTYFTFKINNSAGIIYNYVNQSAVFNGLTNRSFNNITSIYSVNVSDNSIFPASYNYNETYMENNIKSQLNLTSSNQIAKINILNITESQYYVAECYINDSGGVGTSRIYIANSTYNVGNPDTSEGVKIIYTLSSNFPYSHNHTATSKHYIFPFNNETIKNPNQILIKGSNPTNYYINYLNSEMRNGSMQKSTNNGGSYSSVFGTADCHIHFFSGKDTFCYYASAIDNAGQLKESVFICDNLEIKKLAPTSVNIYAPNSSIITGKTVTINYTASIPFYLSSIAYYSIDLYYSNYSIKNTIKTNNSLNLSYVYDSSAIESGNYTIKVTAYDNETLSAFSYSDIFEIDNSKPVITAIIPVLLFTNVSQFYTNQNYDFSVEFKDNNLFITEFMLFLSNGTTWYNETIIRSSTIKNYVFTNSILLPNISGNMTGYAKAYDGGTDLNVKAELEKTTIKTDEQTINNECFTIQFFEPVNKLTLSYLKDRVSYTAEYKDSSMIKKIIITKKCAGFVVYDSLHDKHLVIGKYWIDFLSENTKIIEIIDYGKYYEVEIIYKKALDVVSYNSIGIINEEITNFRILLKHPSIIVTTAYTTQDILLIALLYGVFFMFVWVFVITKTSMILVFDGLYLMFLSIPVISLLPVQISTLLTTLNLTFGAMLLILSVMFARRYKR